MSFNCFLAFSLWNPYSFFFLIFHSLFSFLLVSFCVLSFSLLSFLFRLRRKRKNKKKWSEKRSGKFSSSFQFRRERAYLFLLPHYAFCCKLKSVDNENFLFSFVRSLFFSFFIVAAADTTAVIASTTTLHLICCTRFFNSRNNNKKEKKKGRKNKILGTIVFRGI